MKSKSTNTLFCIYSKRESNSFNVEDKKHIYPTYCIHEIPRIMHPVRDGQYGKTESFNLKRTDNIRTATKSTTTPCLDFMGHALSAH